MRKGLIDETGELVENGNIRYVTTIRII